MEIIIIIAVIIILFYLLIRMDIAWTWYLARLVGSKKRWVGQLIGFIILLPIFLYFFGG